MYIFFVILGGKKLCGFNLGCQVRGEGGSTTTTVVTPVRLIHVYLLIDGQAGNFYKIK
ncbi:hypothetical protein ACE6H2_019671 [Prunus campanulata]